MATELEDRFIKGKKEDRVTLGLVFQALGEFALPHLARILEETQDAWVRKNAAEVLVRMGPSGAQAVLDEMASGRLAADAVAGLLMVFGELGADSPNVVEALRLYAKHRDPRVRMEAAWALCRTAGDAGEPLFLHLLDDRSLEVRQRALRCLRTARCRGGLARVMALVGHVERDADVEALEPQLYAALPDLAEASGANGGESEALLVERLRDAAPHGLLRKARRPLADDALVAVIDALGVVGTAHALEALGDVGRHVKEPARPHVSRATERIGARLHRPAERPPA